MRSMNDVIIVVKSSDVSSADSISALVHPTRMRFIFVTRLFQCSYAVDVRAGQQRWLGEAPSKLLDVDQKLTEDTLTGLEALATEATCLAADWKLYGQMFLDQAERRKLLFDAAGALFVRLDSLMLFSICTAVCRLLDPAEQGRNKNMTLDRLAELIAKDGFEEVATEIRLLLGTAAEHAEGMREFRNKRASHWDQAVATGDKPLLGVTASAINATLQVIGEVVQKVRLLPPVNAHWELNPYLIGNAEELALLVEDGQAARALLDQGKLDVMDLPSARKALGHEPW
jgi:hypothetical protein